MSPSIAPLGLSRGWNVSGTTGLRPWLLPIAAQRLVRKAAVGLVDGQVRTARPTALALLACPTCSTEATAFELASPKDAAIEHPALTDPLRRRVYGLPRAQTGTDSQTFGNLPLLDCARTGSGLEYYGWHTAAVGCMGWSASVDCVGVDLE